MMKLDNNLSYDIDKLNRLTGELMKVQNKQGNIIVNEEELDDLIELVQLCNDVSIQISAHFFNRRDDNVNK